jgi:hypothetical protein
MKKSSLWFIFILKFWTFYTYVISLITFW